MSTVRTFSLGEVLDEADRAAPNPRAGELITLAIPDGIAAEG